METTMVGQNVLFIPSINNIDVLTNSVGEVLPLAAMVVRDWDAEQGRESAILNLMVFPDGGTPVCKTSVLPWTEGNTGYTWKFLAK